MWTATNMNFLFSRFWNGRHHTWVCCLSQQRGSPDNQTNLCHYYLNSSLPFLPPRIRYGHVVLRTQILMIRELHGTYQVCTKYLRTKIQYNLLSNHNEGTPLTERSKSIKVLIYNWSSTFDPLLLILVPINLNVQAFTMRESSLDCQLTFEQYCDSWVQAIFYKCNNIATHLSWFTAFKRKAGRGWGLWRP